MAHCDIPDKRALQAELEALEVELSMLQATNKKATAATKLSPEELHLRLLEARLKRKNADLKRRIADKDFAPRKRRVFDESKSPEIIRLRAEGNRLQQDFNNDVQKALRANETKFQTTKRVLFESLNIPRGIMTAGDLSAFLRQGGFFAFGRPLKTGKLMGAMLKAAASENGAQKLQALIESMPNRDIYRAAKLFLPSISETDITKREEDFKSQLVEKLPFGIGRLVRASNRSYTIFLSLLRISMFDQMTDGRNMTKEELTDVARGVNIATGRGDFAKFGGVAEGLSYIMFSPRHVVSRFQLLLLSPIIKSKGEARKAFAKEYARTAIGFSAFMGMIALALGSDDDPETGIEIDPRSSDFMKVRLGKTRLDVFFGLSQTSTILTRIATRETKTLAGEIKSLIVDDNGFSPRNNLISVIGRFGRSKLAPVPASAINIWTKEGFMGREVTIASTMGNVMVPLAWSDIVSAIEEQGFDRGSALGILSIFGFGLMVYDENEKKAKKSKTKFL